MWRITACVFIILIVNGPNPQSLQFISTPSDVVIAPGSEHTLTCTVIPSTPNVITWYRDDVQVTLGGRFNSRNGGTELVISGVQRSDSGRYACEASNSEGSLRSLGAAIQVAFLESLTSTPSTPLLMVRRGDSFILNCSLPASLPDATVQWFKGSTDVSTVDANRFTVSSSATSSSLIASYYEDADANTYQCQISNHLVDGVMRSYTSAVVTGASGDAIPALTQRFVFHPQDVEVVAGKSAKLQCFVVGQPIPTISWRKDGVLLASRPNVTFSQSQRVLELLNVEPSDAGVYTCISSQDQVTVTNNITTTATLSVIVPPRIVEGVARQEVLVGATLQLRCVAEGTSPITWQWRNNTILVFGDGRVRVNNGQLTISNAKVSDSGVYQCIASHSTSGQDSSSNSVIVTTQQPSFLPNGNPRDTLSFTGQSIQLVCDATGAPPPQYSWIKDSSILDTSVPRIMREEGSGTITITSVRRGQDDGSYYCTASNSDGSDNSTDAVLRVLDLPDVLHSPSNETVSQNSNATIPCAVEIPNAQSVTIVYLWFLNNTQLDLSSQRHQLQGGNLTVFNIQVEDAGEYACVVNVSVSDLMNVEDLQFSNISRAIISVAVLPSSTSMPVISEVQSREVLISWGLPPSDGITHYIIESRVAAIYGTFPVQAGANWITAIDSVSDRQISVPSLHPFTQYQFRVSAVNLAGRGPPSSPSIVTTTLEAAPTAAPTMLEVMTRLNSTELLVAWHPPPVRLSDDSGRNGIVVSYTVKYQRNGSQEEAEMMTTTDNTTSFLLEGLQHSSAYTVMVAASTSQGIGPFTLPVIQSTLNVVPRPPDPPEMLTAVTVNSTTVVLQWREPPLTTTANVTGYLVQYSHPARENSSNSSVPLPSHARTISITDLDGGQLYQFNVSAINTVGTGPPAMYILSTPIGSPTHILSFTGNRLLSNAVFLSWDVPPDGGSELYGFIVEGYSIFEVEWVQLDVLPANATSYELSADDGAIYIDVRISAFNRFGTSAPTVFEVGNPVTPEEDAPDTIWFLVIFVLFGLVVVAFGFLTIVLLSRRCMGEYSGGNYFFRDTDDSEIASSAPSTATFTNFESRTSRKSNAPLFSSEAAPFHNQPRPPSPRAQSPMLSESSKSHLMPQGYPHATNTNFQDNSTLTSGYSIDRPMFSDTTSTDSPAPLGGDYQRGFNTGGAQGQQIGLQERNAKTRSLESNISTYV